jgi:WhiB family redox-sensing transcriptional regulator
VREIDHELLKLYDGEDIIPIEYDLFKAIVRPEWFEQSLCRDVPEASNVELFYPERANTPGGKHLIPARKLCLKCPVRYECLEYGLEDQFGIWGGHSLSQRRRIIVSVKSGSSLIEASQAIDARSRDAR